MADKIATREAYGDALVELADKYDYVVLDADLAEATKTIKFKKAHPERFFDCGIAEGNMISVAAGLAAAGKMAFASSFAMFAAGRAFEQVRNSVGYPHLNVKIGATHAGITVGEDGATHQCLEDIALMRTIPGMTIVNPADAVEARAAVEAAMETYGPFYMRFGRYACPIVTEGKKFELGKGMELRDGKDVTIVATGYMVHLALEAAEALAASAPVCSLNAPTDDEHASVEYYLTADSDPSEALCESIALKSAIRKLSPLQQQIVYLRYQRDLSQSDVGRILSLSQVKVSREEKKILALLKRALSEEDG